MVATTYKEDVDQLVDFLKKEFEIKVTELKYFIGLEINQLQDGSIHINQQAYMKSF